MRPDGSRPALLVAIAGVTSGLTAIPDTPYRAVVLVAAAALVLLALLIAVLPQRPVEPAFTITTPTPDQVVGGGPVMMSGTIAYLNLDTLWVFAEGLVDGRRAWFFGGEALVNGTTWGFEYEPSAGPNDRARRTLSVVRADPKCDRQLRNIRADSFGRLIVHDPAPGGCEVLGQVSIVLAVRP